MTERTNFMEHGLSFSEHGKRLSASAEPLLHFRVTAQVDFEGKTYALSFVWDEAEGNDKYESRAEAIRFALAHNIRMLRGDFGPENQAIARQSMLPDGVEA